MAKLTPGFLFTGTLGNISAYTRRGSDSIILRSKGGPSKKQIKSDPRFVNVRRNNMEFGGRSSTVKHILQVIHPLRPLADINVASFLGKMLVTAQRLDTESVYGQRSVLLSRQPQLLEGFDMNEKNIFSSIIRSPLLHTLSRTAVETKIDIPALLPGINFFVPGKYPLFSMIGTVGVVPDMVCKNNLYVPAAIINSIHTFRKAETPWLPCSNGSAATTLDLTMQELPAGNDWSLLLAVGIRFATIGADGSPQQIKYSGAAKILGMR